MLLVMRVLSIVPLNFKVRYFIAWELDTNSLTSYTPLFAFGLILKPTAAGMVSSTFSRAPRLQFFHSITFPFSPDAFGSHHA
jgi:hypothetical protein